MMGGDAAAQWTGVFEQTATVAASARGRCPLHTAIAAGDRMRRDVAGLSLSQLRLELVL